MRNRRQFRSEVQAREGPPGPCPECPKFKGCTELCEDVEKWVSQDHVGHNNRFTILQNNERVATDNSFLDDCALQPENIVVEPDPELAKAAWDRVVLLNIPKKAMEFAELFYHQGKTLAQTAAGLKISSQAASDRHETLKREIKDRLQRCEIWAEIKDEYRGTKLKTKEVVIMMYYGLLMTPIKIAGEMDLTNSRVYDIVRKWKEEYLDI